MLLFFMHTHTQGSTLMHTNMKGKWFLLMVSHELTVLMVAFYFFLTQRPFAERFMYNLLTPTAYYKMTNLFVTWLCCQLDLKWLTSQNNFDSMETQKPARLVNLSNSSQSLKTVNSVVILTPFPSTCRTLGGWIVSLESVYVQTAMRDGLFLFISSNKHSMSHIERGWVGGGDRAKTSKGRWNAFLSTDKNVL